MPTNPTEQVDAVKEAQELLSRLNEWPDSIIDIKHALFADAVERERDSPFFGCSTPVADLYGRAPELLKILADEVEARRNEIKTLELTVEGLLDRIGVRETRIK